jgi:hypothetical protein
MSALISRTDDIICMLDVNMMVEKLRAMLKFFETDTQTHRLFQKGQIRYQESILRHFRAKKKILFKNTQKWTDQT